MLLGKSTHSLKENKTDLSPLIPLSIGLIGNTTTKLITPALIGGVDGQMISNLVEFHMRSSNNWELASAMGGILLFITLALYAIYNRLVGVNNMKLG